MSASWTDVGGRHWSKRWKIEPKNVGSRRWTSVRQCHTPTSACLADVGHRHPPSCRSCSTLASSVILCNFSLYVAVHFNSSLCNSPSLTAYYPFAPTHRWFLAFNEFLLKRSVHHPRLEPATSLLQGWHSTT